MEVLNQVKMKIKNIFGLVIILLLLVLLTFSVSATMNMYISSSGDSEGSSTTSDQLDCCDCFDNEGNYVGDQVQDSKIKAICENMFIMGAGDTVQFGDAAPVVQVDTYAFCVEAIKSGDIVCDPGDCFNRECCDGKNNNDGDILIDIWDPGCYDGIRYNPWDDNECDYIPKKGEAECSDGIDNDGDGFIDFEEDFGCRSILDFSENEKDNPQCSNRIDDDGDGLIDFDGFSYNENCELVQDISLRDPDCLLPGDNSEKGVQTVDLSQGGQLGSQVAGAQAAGSQQPKEGGQQEVQYAQAAGRQEVQYAQAAAKKQAPEVKTCRWYFPWTCF